MRAERAAHLHLPTLETPTAVNVAEGARRVIRPERRQQQVNGGRGCRVGDPRIATRPPRARTVANATQTPGGYEAMQLRVAGDAQPVRRAGEGGEHANLPANLTDVASMIALAMNVIRRQPDGRP